VCGARWREEISLKGRDHLHHLDIIGIVISVLSDRKIPWVGVNQIHLIVDRDNWPAVASTVIQFRLP